MPELVAFVKLSRDLVIPGEICKTSRFDGRARLGELSIKNAQQRSRDARDSLSEC